MRNVMSAVIAAGWCLSQPAVAIAGPMPQQDADYTAVLRCYGFHVFKIELGTAIKDTEIADAGRDQSQFDLNALRKYADGRKLDWGTVQAAADKEAAARKLLYTGGNQDKRMEALMGDQEYCASEAFVDILLKYQ